MKKFLISAKVTVSVYTKVEVETLEGAIEGAIEIANDRTPMEIIANGGYNEDENWMLDEIDGEPFDLHEE